MKGKISIVEAFTILVIVIILVAILLPVFLMDRSPVVGTVVAKHIIPARTEWVPYPMGKTVVMMPEEHDEEYVIVVQTDGGKIRETKVDYYTYSLMGNGDRYPHAERP